MNGGRKQLPSTTALQVLIELAKSGFTTSAARALNMSQSAVSKQLISLEQHVGAPLFVRTNSGLMLSDAGRIYLECASTVIRAMEDAALLTAKLQPNSETLRLQVPPILGDRWLLPRFFEFAEANPDIDVHFTSFDTAATAVPSDGIFSFSERAPAPGRSIRLFGNDVLLVASPEYWRKLNSPTDFEDLHVGTILEHPNTPINWHEFLEQKKIAVQSPRILQFGYYTMVIRAALEGKGMAFVPRELIEQDLNSGRLVSPPSFRYEGSIWYWFTPSLEARASTALAVFIKWLKSII